MPKQSPSLATPAVDERGYFTQQWVRFFTGLIAPPKAFTAFTLGLSPASVMPSEAGNLLISGGTVSSVKLRRGGSMLTLPGTSGLYPVSNGDEIIVTYTVAPTVQFIPS